MDIDYDYYRIFYYVAKCGSITQAAKRLLHDQPNLTRMIKLLEGELGCALFYRTNRGVRLTPEGKRLYVTIGQFGIIRLERDSQLLIPSYDYCLPQKECSCSENDDPCETFSCISFPVGEFFPGAEGCQDG